MKTKVEKVIIGDCTLYRGDCLEIMPTISEVDHAIFDGPYEEIMHKAKAKASKRKLRTDKGPEIKSLNFSSIDAIRADVVAAFEDIVSGWMLSFCSPEGIKPWADEINRSKIKYKRACFWIKPDSAPQFNGQGPAMAVEAFIAAWCGCGFSKWNGGGKRNFYVENTNAPDRDGRHETEKPWRLFTKLLNDFTNEGQTILDPFMGSGTTGVAYAKTGRKFIGIELDSDYFEIACDRIRKAYEQPDLFVSAPATPVQESLI